MLQRDNVSRENRAWVVYNADMTQPSFAGSTILVADDESEIRELFEDLLESSGATLVLAATGSEALTAIKQHQIDLAILDVRMPDPGGLAVLQRLREQDSSIPVLILTAYPSSSMAIESSHLGAFDYLPKPFNVDHVLDMIERALEHRSIAKRAHPLQTPSPDPRDTIIGQSGPMQEIYKMIGRVAASDATVLITGESGTGKELVARTLHESSPRRQRPFVTVNCAALTETLLETELFGHEKGAFTGATARRKGRFEQADSGTIFLDEIGEISPAMQKKLLRVLQEHSFERVGGNVSVQVDVRILTATNRDLLRELQAGAFREDLFYRLNVVNLHMPALRERADDIPLLAEHFLRKAQQKHNLAEIRLTSKALQVLQQYHWPGNVRQLENAIERASVLAQDGLITAEALVLENSGAHSSLLAAALSELLCDGIGLTEILERVRRTAWELAVHQHQGDQEAAARMLQIEDSSLEHEA
jgi:two-component system response regulator AtoC